MKKSPLPESTDYLRRVSTTTPNAYRVESEGGMAECLQSLGNQPEYIWWKDPIDCRTFMLKHYEWISEEGKGRTILFPFKKGATLSMIVYVITDDGMSDTIVAYEKSNMLVLKIGCLIVVPEL